MPEPIRVIAVPPWAVALVILVGTTLAVLIVSLVVLGVSSRLRRRPDEDGPSLAELADPILRARTGVGRFDAEFDRLAQGTQLGLTGESASTWIVLAGAVAASAVYVATFSELLALAAAFAAGLGVFLIFLGLQNRRRLAIQEQLPDGCFQLSRSLRSGLNLPGALRETSGYLPAPLSGLFARLAVALSLGESTRDSVRRVASDARVTEFDLVTEVIALNAESGGNLPVMLERLGNSIRDRNQYRGYFRSTTTLARVAAIFLALAAPAALLLYWVLPDQRVFLYQFLAMREGAIMLGVAAVLWLLGIGWIIVLLRRQDDY